MLGFFASRGPPGPLPPPANATLAPLHDRGGASIASSSLWAEQTAVVLTLRRPG